MNNLDECWETYWKIGKDDLETSKILFNAEKYPQALFYLQQSVEKLVKTVFFMTVRGLYSDNFGAVLDALRNCNLLRKQQLQKLTPENLCTELPRAFGHSPTRKYLKFLVCAFSRYYVWYSERMPDKPERTEKMREALDNFRHILEEPERTLDSFTPEIILNKILEMEEFKISPSEENISSYLEEHLEGSPEILDAYKVMSQLLWSSMNVLIDAFEIVWLGILFEVGNVHSWSRYPTDGKTPFELTYEKMLEFRFSELLEIVDRLYSVPENVSCIVNTFKESIPMFRVASKELREQQKVERNK